MKLATYQLNNKISIGAVRDNSIVDLSSIAPDMLSFIAAGSSALDRARELTRSARQAISIDSVKLLAPIPNPRRNIMCLGQNYEEHARERARSAGKEYVPLKYPTFFTKATHTINGPYDDIPFDASVSKHIDWEAELGVILGRSGKNIPLDRAMDYVFGYACINDVTARDLQAQHTQFFKGKSLDGSCPLGPWIVTADEIADPHALKIMSRVNGVTKQDSTTGEMIFKIPQLISILSCGMTLDAGDIISTGTPSGVGEARTPPEFLKPGDIVEVEVERIGLLRNRIS
ncbi:MAG TPA: fumarylacetoacetate hydrolase family protein [Anaerolineae bacterium]|nr:fumarylacetoacetate hydrolase family protein [Anaerolineae bacterium]